MTAVEQLAQFVVARSWDHLSDVTWRELKIRVLDSLGCALGALGAPPIEAIRAQVDDFVGRPVATLIAGRASAPDRAALYNGALVRYLDFKNYGIDVNLFVDHNQIVQLEGLRAGIWGTQDTWGRMLAYRE